MGLIRKARDAYALGHRITPNTLLAARRLRAHADAAHAGDIVVHWPTRVRMSDSSRVSVASGGRLLIGGGGHRVFGDDAVRCSLRFGPESVLFIRGRVRLGLGTKMRVGKGARVEIGDDTQIGSNCRIFVNAGVSIGSGCRISWDVTVMDHNGHDLVADDGSVPDVTGVTIGDHVWIGQEALLLGGVTVGDGAVIAARSVVTSAVPPNAVVAGVPARVVREQVEWRA